MGSTRSRWDIQACLTRGEKSIRARCIAGEIPRRVLAGFATIPFGPPERILADPLVKASGSTYASVCTPSRGSVPVATTPGLSLSLSRGDTRADSSRDRWTTGRMWIASEEGHAALSRVPTGSCRRRGSRSAGRLSATSRRSAVETGARRFACDRSRDNCRLPTIGGAPRRNTPRRAGAGWTGRERRNQRGGGWKNRGRKAGTRRHVTPRVIAGVNPPAGVRVVYAWPWMARGVPPLLPFER